MKRLDCSLNYSKKLLSVGCLAALLGVSSHGADVFKADNLDNLNLTTSWDGGVAPGASDVAVWDNRVATAVPQNILLGADLSWAGIRIVDPAGPVNIAPGNTLALGASGIDTTSAAQSLVFSNAVAVGAPQVWSIVLGVTVRGGLSGTSLVTKNGTGTLTITAVSPTLTRIQIDQGTVSSAAGNVGSTIMALNGGTFSVNAALSTPVEVMAGGGIVQNTGGNRTLSGAVSGNGPLTVNASSTFTWSASNSFSGIATVQGSGTLRLSSVNAVSANATYILNATMSPNAAGLFNLGSLSGAGNLTGGAGQNFSIGALSTDTTFSGVISSAGLIIKTGTGTLTLDGANTYAGATIISNGVLQIGSGGFTGKFGTGSVTNLSRLVFNRADTLLVPNAIHGTGSVTNINFGKATLTGASTYSGQTVITAGTLSFGTASLATGNITVGDSAAAGVTVTSSGATLTEGNISFGTGSAYEFDLGTFGNHPGTVVSNTGTITINSPVTVNLAGTNFSVGTITLMRYASRTGAGSFVLGSLPSNVSATLDDDSLNKVLRLNITSVVNGIDMTFRWLGGIAGDWDIDNLANQIWQVVGTGQITNYTEGVAVRFDDTATGTTNVNITTFINPATVTVNSTNKTYTFGGTGSLSGGMSLTKSGPGTLFITNANLYSGQTYIEGGKLVVAGESGSISGSPITNNAALVFDRTGATNILPNTVLLAGQITGSGSVTFMGVDSTNSILELEIGTPDGNPYAGGTTISNAFVRLNANPVSDATRSAAKSTGLGTGQITFLGDSMLELEDYGVGNNSGQAGTFAAPLNVSIGQTGTFRTAGRMTVNSALTGAGTFNLVVSYVRDIISGNFSAFTGQLNVSPSPNTTGNQFQIANAAGLPAAQVHLATGVTLGGNAPMGNNSVVPIGELSADAGSFIDTVGENPRTAIFSVGGLNTSSAFAGNINGPHSLRKVGVGTLTLSGANTFTGTTTVSNGVLALVGETGLSNNPTLLMSAPAVLDVLGRTDATLWLGSGAVTQTLTGNGTIQGNLAIGASGVLAPKAILNVSGTVALAGVAAMDLNRGSLPNSSRVASSSISAGGALTVTNVGVALQVGDTFQLFSTPVSGSFASVTLPTNDIVNLAAYTWTNKLSVDGTIVVLTTTPLVNQTPTNITFSVSGGSLDLQWPSDHIGWTLQTNSIGLTAANQWFAYTGSAQTNHVILTIDPSKPNVFYRLVYP